MSEVVWKDVVGYEGLYEVNNEGLVRTNKHKVTFTKMHGKRTWKQRILKNRTPKGRDVRVSLWKDGKSKDCLVHRLVAEAFIPKIKGKEFINHIDGNPKNNHVSNLEWCDYKENNNHAFDNDLIKTNKKVILVNKKTGEPFMFRSLTKASEFLGHSHAYLSREIKKGRSDIEGYEVYLKAN
ncbi:NUMOD4 motif-containing HNH endonuclease [Lysinibacillus sphaericus]|uniref:NUMOD4 motif-containing HNH endonuclease n=1 Tax=Lysinibacillus sphaericus TaxID=1421 RepID=UPI0005607135|nr:NUMOD4 motif-containing HNH endonuclease [Lysinibacillus sphaericus]